MSAHGHGSHGEEQSPSLARRVRLADDIERFLNRFTVRLVLSVAIIVSLLPTEFPFGIDMLFLGMFGAEFCARLFITIYAHRGAEEDPGEDFDPGHAGPRSRARALTLLVVDFLALVSFIPPPVSMKGARYLRLFRLTRMLLLAGYWAPLVRDVWAILSRRERMRQIVLMGFVVAGLSFAGAVFLHYVGGTQVDANADGVLDAKDHDFKVMLWWAFRQVQDPGNIVESPKAVPLLITSVALTVFGLFLVSFLIGLGTDVVRELLARMQLRPPGLRNHTVIVNITPSTRRLLLELMRYYKRLLPTEARAFTMRWFSDLRARGLTGNRYLVVGGHEEPPDFLRQPDLSKIVYRERAQEDELLIARADLLAARRILLLADPDEESPDAGTIKTLLTLVERIAERERVRPELQRFEKQRVIIAEILDESNVAAAEAAVRTGTESFRAFVVPTERLLALFIAGVVRRPGLGHLLEELLTSRGHELYTCFFHTDGLGFQMDNPPQLGGDHAAAMQRLMHLGLERGDRSDSTVVPLGLLTGGQGAHGSRDFEVEINPQPGEGGADIVGFIAIADGFPSVSDFAERIDREMEAEAEAEARPVLPAFAPTPRTPIHRVLLCGFRPGAIYMLEELLRGQEGAQVLVLVESAAEREQAEAALVAHTHLVASDLMPARHALFEPQGEGTFEFSCPGEPERFRSRVHVRVADWMESRHLVDLPHPDFTHVGEVDAIVFVAEEDGSADSRTTTALLKLESLFAARSVPHGKPRVVAEVFDARLAERLQAHTETVGRHHIRIYSIQALRAFFLFQSVVVPGFDRVYSELLGSWGESFVRFRPSEAMSGACTFHGMATVLAERGCLLIGVELIGEHGGRDLWIAPSRGEPGAEFDLSELRSVWAVAPDRMTAESVETTAAQ